MTELYAVPDSDAAPMDAHSPMLCARGCSHSPTPRILCRCPQCDAISQGLVRGYERETAARDAAAQAKRVAALSSTTELGADRTMANFVVRADNREAHARAERVMHSDFTLGLGLYGVAKGVGKSHLAAALVNAAHDRGLSAAYIGFPALLRALKATFDGRATTSEDDLIRTFAAVRVLALDDYGKEAATDYAVRTIYDLVNERVEGRRPIILTSNFSYRELAARELRDGADADAYTATLDRLKTATSMTTEPWVHLTGKSWR